MLLITYFTTYRVILSTCVLSVINNIIATPKIPSSIDKIVDGFPYPMTKPIFGTTYYASIADIHLKFNSNAASVQSNLERGTLGLLLLTVLPAVYASFCTIAFVTPVNPGPKPSIHWRDWTCHLQFTVSPHIIHQYLHRVQKHGQRPLSDSLGVYRQTVCLIHTQQIYRLQEVDYSSVIRLSLFYVRWNFRLCTPRQLQETPCSLRQQSDVRNPDQSGRKCG